MMDDSQDYPIFVKVVLWNSWQQRPYVTRYLWVWLSVFLNYYVSGNHWDTFRMSHPRLTSAIRAFNGAVSQNHTENQSGNQNLQFKRHQRANRKSKSSLSWHQLVSTVKRRSSDKIAGDKLQRLTQLSRQLGNIQVYHTILMYVHVHYLVVCSSIANWEEYCGCYALQVR